jgi:hypothetical protein
MIVLINEMLYAGLSLDIPTGSTTDSAYLTIGFSDPADWLKY